MSDNAVTAIPQIHKAFFPSGNLAKILMEKYDTALYRQDLWSGVAKEIMLLRVEAAHYRNGSNSYSYLSQVFPTVLVTSLNQMITHTFPKLTQTTLYR